MRIANRGLAWILGATVALATLSSAARAQNQTPTLSPIVVGGGLPYTVSLRTYNFGGVAQLPTLQSFALGVYQGQWVIVAGRTNGLHNFTADGFQNFPPAYQNTIVWVINPVTKTVQSRSLSDPTSGLTVAQVDSLSATNTEFTQVGNTLYVAGGYVYDRTADLFTTYDTLTALDLAGVIDWVQGAGTLAAHVRQTSNATLKVTGGDFYVINNRALLTLGQDYEGGYNPGIDGTYTEQIRAFDIVDNGVTLSITNLTSSTPADEYRRRDLNVVPMQQSNGMGGFTQGLIALAGVFNVYGGAWTVPVEISATGTPSMADPNLPATFKQGMNTYRSANISLYSESLDETHTIALGGISLEYYNTSTGQIAYDSNLPFINSLSSIVRTASGAYTQYYLGEFPTVPNPGNGGLPFIFGAGAQFIPAAGVDAYGNGMLKLDAITQPTVVGYVFGGIIAQQANFGATGASNLIFEVTISPAVAPTPAPTPVPAPVCRVHGKGNRHTTASSLVINGTASAATPSIEWRRGGSEKKQNVRVLADGSWKFRIGQLGSGRNVVKIRGVGLTGLHSAASTVVIERD